MNKRLVSILMLLIIFSSFAALSTNISTIPFIINVKPAEASPGGATIDVSTAVRITSSGDSSGDGYYERDAQLLMASGGTWYLTYSKSQTSFNHGSNPDDLQYDIYVKKSSDGGVTWSAETKVLDAAAISSSSSFRSSTICEADGKIWDIGSDIKDLKGDIYANTYSSGTWSGQTKIFNGAYSTGAFHLDSIVEGNDIRLFYGIQQETQGVGFIKYHSSTHTWDTTVTKIGPSAGYQIPRVIKAGSTYYMVSTNWDHILFTKTTTPDIVPWPSATDIFDAPPSGAACDPTILKYGESGGTDDLIVFSSPSYSDNSQPIEYVYSTDAGTTWTSPLPFTHAAHGTEVSWDMMSRAYLKDPTTIMLFYSMEQRGVNRGQGDIVVCDWSTSSTIGNKHYTTIQDGVDAANPGDTIVVHDGTYYEHLVVNKPLTITSASSPIIDGGASGYCITVSANNVVISGFEIRNGYLGISIQNAIGTQVCNNRIIDFIKGGIVARGAKNIFIEGNNISTTLHDEAPNGIDIGTYSGTTGIVRGNRISGCSWDGFTGDYEVTWSGSGILVIESGDSLEIIGNTVHDCDVGMDIESDLMNITYNEVYDNVYGFVFWNANPKVNYNNIYSNTQYGVYRTAGGDLRGVLDARYNWWGDPTGPYNPELNLSGKGDKVSDNVNFEPWLIKAYPPPVPVKTLLYIDPAETICWTPVYNHVFTVEIKVENVTDLYGYGFKLYWNTTLLDFEFANIEELWFPNTKIETLNESLGMYWLAFAGLGEQPSFNGSATLVTLYFKIKYDPIYPENVYSLLDLRETKLGTPPEPLFSNPIPHMVRDGKYWCYSTKPKIMVEPTTSKAKKLGKTFQVNITVQDVVNLYKFEFYLYYNTTLLDAQDVVPGPFLNAPVVDMKSINEHYNSTHGEVAFRVYSTPTAPCANGTGVLAIITFETTLASIWPEPELNCTLSLGSTKLITNEGLEVPHNRIDGEYRYTPVIGDLNSDGIVDPHDLYIIALAFGSKPGDPNWNKHADLDGSKEVDVFDMIVVAYNWRKDC